MDACSLVRRIISNALYKCVKDENISESEFLKANFGFSYIFSPINPKFHSTLIHFHTH